ncbi:hypothetical protein DSO57_1000988 [Entomophthora muscae]|uniref:Uncharacterized protein n=1 Tax=Entomophthora muscae TaxID=34485 RepID=A0ACC2UJ39_9FUNG|nr:hypothetical protein DSO57_1000988 [Entomophthora muscae]
MDLSFMNPFWSGCIILGASFISLSDSILVISLVSLFEDETNVHFIAIRDLCLRRQAVVEECDQFIAEDGCQVVVHVNGDVVRARGFAFRRFLECSKYLSSGIQTWVGHGQKGFPCRRACGGLAEKGFIELAGNLFHAVRG